MLAEEEDQDEGASEGEAKEGGREESRERTKVFKQDVSLCERFPLLSLCLRFVCAPTPGLNLFLSIS